MFIWSASHLPAVELTPAWLTLWA